jgi:hypothetical protein
MLFRRFRLKRILMALAIFGFLVFVYLSMHLKTRKSHAESEFDWEKLSKLKPVEENRTKTRREVEKVILKRTKAPKKKPAIATEIGVPLKELNKLKQTITTENSKSPSEAPKFADPTYSTTPKSPVVLDTATKTKKKKSNVKESSGEAAEVEFVRAILSLNNEADKIEYDRFDKHCDQNGEWETIDNTVFIKRSAGFYFHDANLIRVHMLVKSYVKVKFYLNVSVELLTEMTTTHIKIEEDIKMKSRSMVSGYNFVQLDAFFDVNYHVRKIDIDNAKLTISFYEQYSRVFSKSSIRLISKLANEDTNGPRSGAMICSKCLNIKALTQYSGLKWWLDLNKNIGSNLFRSMNF